jgi:hypothetical protein
MIAGRYARVSINRGMLLRLLVLIDIVVAGVVLSYNIVQPSALFWLAVLGILGGLVVLSNNALAITILAGIVFLVDWMSQVIQVIPRQITWLPDLILIALGLKVLFYAAKERRFYRTAIDAPLMFLLIFGFISAFINGVRLEVVIFGIRNLFIYVILFYVVSQLQLDEIFVRRATKLIIAIGFLQIPIALYQRIANLNFASGDVVVGTIGANASGTLSLFLLMVVAIIVSSYLNKLISIKFLVISILLLFIPMVINETKVTFIIFPLLMIFLISHSLLAKSTRKRALAPILLSAIVFSSAVLGYNLLFADYYNRGQGILSESQISNITRPYTKEGTLNRLTLVQFAYIELNRPPLNPYIGVGLGNASDSFFTNGVGAYFTKYKQLNISGTFFARFMWELGYIGLLAFAYMIIRLIIMAERIFKHSQDPFRKTIALAFQGIVLIMAIGIVYSGAFTLGALPLVFWFLAGCLQRWDIQEYKLSAQEESVKT